MHTLLFNVIYTDVYLIPIHATKVSRRITAENAPPTYAYGPMSSSTAGCSFCGDVSCSGKIMYNSSYNNYANTCCNSIDYNYATFNLKADFCTKHNTYC